MSKPNYTWINFEGNQHCNAKVVVANSVTELKHILARATAEGKTVRVSSGGRKSKESASYSASSVVNNGDGYIVLTPGLNKVHVHDDGSNRITAEAGATIGELEKAARKNGLSFETMPVPKVIQVGGAVSLANHGVTNEGGTLSDLVVGMEILLADGNILKVSEEDEEFLDAARVNLGVLGIVISVTFQCVSLYKLSTVDAKVDLKETIDNIESIVESNDYVDLFWFPYTTKIWLKTWKRVGEDVPLKNVPGLYAKNREWLAGQVSIFSMELMIRFPRLTPYFSRMLLGGIQQKKMVAYTDDVYHYQRYFPVKLHDLSYNLDVGENFDNFKKCFYHMVQKIEEYAKPKKCTSSPWPWAYEKGARFPQKFTTHVRFIKTSKSLLSPARGNKFSVYLEALTYFGADYKDYYNELENYWKQFGARPHWGKTFDETQDFEQLFGDGLMKFNEIRKRLDPDGVFLNDFMRHVFKEPMKGEVDSDAKSALEKSSAHNN